MSQPGCTMCKVQSGGSQPGCIKFQALLFLSRINRTRYIPPLSHTIIPPPARWLLRSSANACGTFHFSTDHGSSRIPDRSLRPGGFLMRRSFAFLGSKGSDSDDDSSHDSNRAKRSSPPKVSSSTRFLGSSRSSPEHGAAGRFAAPIGRGWADASPSSTILDSRGGAHPPAGAGGSSPTRPSRRFGGLPIAPSGSHAFDTPGEGSLRSTFLGSSDAADVRSLLGSAPGSEPGPPCVCKVCK